MNRAEQSEFNYLSLIVDRIRVCRTYRPQFGQGHSVSLGEFATLYGSDPFYAWFGLDHPLVYASHRAAGGITSLYRQIGIGCELLFRQIIRDHFQLTPEQSTWSYVLKSPGRADRRLSLDARIQIADIRLEHEQLKFQQWMAEASSAMRIDTYVASALKGAVFEVRQGYKSKDSKRQNADISNAGTAYSQGYLPVVTMLSTQIDSDVANRYVNAGWLLLRGHLSESPISSTFAFCSQVLGYDLAQFFEMHSQQIREEVEEVVQALLNPEDSSGNTPIDFETGSSDGLEGATGV